MTSASGDQGATLTVAADGYTDLPPGLLATLVTYLEMTEPPAPRPERATAGLELRPVPTPALDWYRALYTAVGEDWLWFSRRAMSDDALRAILHDPAVEVFVLLSDGAEIGLLELDRRVVGEVELAFFGLIPDAVGGGAGRYLMNRALERAWAATPAGRPRRVWVHTCAFDHPAALDFYRRSGFRPTKRAVEFGRDPRLTGVLPRTAAPQIPLIE